MLFEEYIYASLCGELPNPHPEVADLFAEGMPCEKWYSNVLEAYQSVCSRLGEFNEDDDIEGIITNMNRIQHEIAIQMFRYGMQFADNKTDV